MIGLILRLLDCGMRVLQICWHACGPRELFGLVCCPCMFRHWPNINGLGTGMYMVAVYPQLCGAQAELGEGLPCRAQPMHARSSGASHHHGFLLLAAARQQMLT